MFYSNDAKLLFIAPPKTGSTSVERILESYFPDGERFAVRLDHDIFTSNDVSSPSLGHAKAAEFRALLGEKSYNELTVFGFVRNPIEKVVSSYSFTKAGSIRSGFSRKTRNTRASNIIKNTLRILSARLLPLSIWSVFYRMRSCHDYFTDADGEIIVDILGSTDRLSLDLAEIIGALGVELNAEAVPQINRSSHRSPEDYLLFRYLIPMLERRYRKDMDLYELVLSGVWKHPSLADRSHSNHR